MVRCLTVVLLGLSLFATSCAGLGPEGPGGEGGPSPTREANPTLPPGPPVSPEASPAGEGIAHAASTLSGELAGDPRFASVEVTGGSRLLVHWYGPVDSKLRDLISQFPNVDVEVISAPCSPGKLNAFARELLASDPAVNITSVSPDGSQLTVTLHESAKGASDVAGLERKYSEAAGCPVKVEFGGVVPAGS